MSHVNESCHIAGGMQTYRPSGLERDSLYTFSLSPTNAAGDAKRCNDTGLYCCSVCCSVCCSACCSVCSGVYYSALQVMSLVFHRHWFVRICIDVATTLVLTVAECVAV